MVGILSVRNTDNESGQSAVIVYDSLAFAAPPPFL